LNAIALPLIHPFAFNLKDSLEIKDTQAIRQGILCAFEEHLIKLTGDESEKLEILKQELARCVNSTLQFHILFSVPSI